MRKPDLGTHASRVSTADASGSERTAKAARTASRRPGRALRAPRAEAARPRARSFRVSGLTFVILGVLVAGVVVLAPGLRLFIEQRQELAELRQSVTDKQNQNNQLGSEIARWDDPAYIKAQARERLYYVMPGEISFLVIDDQPPVAAADSAPVSNTIQSTRVDWLGAIFSSGISAGLSTQTPDQLQQSGTIQ